MQHILWHVWIMLLQNPYFWMKITAQMQVAGNVKEI